MFFFSGGFGILFFLMFSTFKNCVSFTGSNSTNENWEFGVENNCAPMIVAAVNIRLRNESELRTQLVETENIVKDLFGFESLK